MRRASWFSAVGVALLAPAWVACDRKEAPPPPVQVIPVQGFVPPPQASESADRPSRPARPHDADGLSAYATAAPESGKSVGHTSVVFKLKLEGGLEAAYKPRSKRGPARYKGEIAAFRLAQALGLPNVPPALLRSFGRAELLKALGGETTDPGALLVKEGIFGDAGELPGALIPWIPHLDFLPLEADPLLSEWHAWLYEARPIPEEKRPLAAQISTLLVFDYVTGNWDRWSGGNIGFTVKGRTVLFIDNDGAFYEVPPAGPLAAGKARLTEVRRFSRAFVGRLRGLDAATLTKALGSDADGGPLLTEKALAGVLERRQEALGIIDARLKKSGEGEGLDFD